MMTAGRRVRQQRQVLQGPVKNIAAPAMPGIFSGTVSSVSRILRFFFIPIVFQIHLTAHEDVSAKAKRK